MILAITSSGSPKSETRFRRSSTSKNPACVIQTRNHKSVSQARVFGGVHLLLEGHEGDVGHTAFSPDGTRIVTASADNTAQLWDANTGALITPLEGHGRGVNHAVFSPDGTRIVTASEDGTARIWDANTGALITSLNGHGNGVYHAAFSPDGTRIVTVSSDTTARIWDAMAEQYTWTREDMFRLGCARKELNGFAEYTENSPILSGLNPDGTTLRDPCERHGLKSPTWWRVKAGQAWRWISGLLN